jgi:hypothetical protein
MRRVVAIAAGLTVLGGASVGASAAIGSGQHGRSVSSTTVRDAAAIAATLSDPAVRSRYEIPAGTLVSATVCIRDACATKRFAPEPTCASTSAACIGTALITRKVGRDTTISVELI